MSSLVHHLITIDVGLGHLHGYLMVPRGEKKLIMDATEQVLSIAEKHFPHFLPIILDTELDDGNDGVDLVRQIICKQFPYVKKSLDAAEDCHLTIWMVGNDHPDAARLMDLH